MFYSKKTLKQHSGANFKNPFVKKICIIFMLFHPFSAYWIKKTRKKHILTGVWSEQHPNTSQNIHHFFQLLLLSLDVELNINLAQRKVLL